MADLRRSSLSVINQSSSIKRAVHFYMRHNNRRILPLFATSPKLSNIPIFKLSQKIDVYASKRQINLDPKGHFLLVSIQRRGYDDTLNLTACSENCSVISLPFAFFTEYGQVFDHG